MKNVYVFDVEGDSLDPTRIHCLCYHRLSDGLVGRLVNYEDIVLFLGQAEVLIGHNIILFDIPVLERLLKIKIGAKLVDTLVLSWYLEPERQKHGLEEWGEVFGSAKVRVDDWENLPVEEYIKRCEQDVRINTELWKRFKHHLTRIYGDWSRSKQLIDYLTFKMDCAREQERSKWLLDRDYALESNRKLTEARDEKLAGLVQAMPPTPLYASLNRPQRPYKKDGTLSVAGAKWFNELRVQNLPENFTGEIKRLISYEPPNPSSPVQIKNWLYSLSWKPITFKYKRDKETGDVRSIPQINLDHGGGLCPSVLRMVDTNPELAQLADLGVINHRIGILSGFIDNVDDQSYIKAQIQGLTNTLRFKHKTVVNLPKVIAAYGEEIRGCLVAPEGEELCGSDMSSLEDRLKQHYIYPHDPEYVKEMNIDGYDPHLSLAQSAGELTKEQVLHYKDGTDKSSAPIRAIFKNGNYACQYGAGPPRLALTANISLKKAKQVHEAYWKKNWAIKVVAAEQKVKIIDGQMWLFNPISELWYSLRKEKDIFSTLVQGSAAYVFDKWVENFREVRPQLTAQFHDEVVLTIKKGHREEATILLKNAIDKLNSQLHLNRELDIGTQFGDKYSEIH